MDGLLVVDKPAGPTSHDVVARVRRALRQPRVGHTGTLDPAATGVLCLVLGRATRLAQFLTASDKTYEAVVRFGFATDTGDAEGRATTLPGGAALPERDAIEAALDAFRGTFLQQPPAFSAKKIGGRRSHELARARTRASVDDDAAANELPGPPAPVSVTTRSLAIVSVGVDTVTLRLVCSAGFYVRSLAHDLGVRLGVGAHLAALRRTRSGDFGLDRAIDLDTVERYPDTAAKAVIAPPDMLPTLPSFQLSSDGVRRARNGCVVGQGDSVSGESPMPHPQPLIRLLDPAGSLVGVARGAARPGFLHPVVVLM
jgi:tRNA pseudouridine55 synthase